MRRLSLILSMMIQILPAASYGQDWCVPFDDPWSGTRATTTRAAEPLPQTELFLNNATFRDSHVEQLDEPDSNPPMSSIEFGDFLVRGQSDGGNSGGGGDSGGGGENLTTQTNDPTASLIQFEIQNFFTTDSYEASGHGYRLNLLPVIPIQWSLFGFDRMINRPSVPIFGPTVDPDGPVDSESGLGDIFDTHLFIKEASWGTWGVGTAINFPTATDPALGSREWQLGPSAVVIMKSKNKKWLYGGLVLAPFSLQSEAKSVSFQPIIVRFLPDDWYLGNGFQVWNWQTSSGNFAMPLTFKVGKVFKEVKPLPLNIGLQGSYTPDDWHQGPAPKWQFLFQVVVLIPGG
jgi:hypothetical protein